MDWRRVVQVVARDLGRRRLRSQRRAGGLDQEEDPPVGPDPCSLVTAEEIKAVTGGSIDKAPRTNGQGSINIMSGEHKSRLRICEWKLSNGDEFLVSLGTAYDNATIHRAWDQAGLQPEEKEMAGVGERGYLRVAKYKDGTSEVGVTAIQGRYDLTLSRESARGETAHEELKKLLQTALGRLDT